MNTINLTGRLTRDPELRTTPAGNSVASFTLAVDRDYKDANGERQADFIDVIAWRQLADLCGKYLFKGNLAGVTGRLQTRNYETKDGNKRKAYEVVADKVEFLTPKAASAAPSPSPAPASGYEPAPAAYYEDDDLPF